MDKRYKKALFLAACFLGPMSAYRFICSLTARDTLNRIGYYLWLHASPEDLLNWLRMNAITGFYQVLLPILLGLAGLGWGILWLKWKGLSRQ